MCWSLRSTSPKISSGLESDILLSMHCGPQTKREKAFAALIYLKADKVNTMVLWDTEFQFEVRRRNRAISLSPGGERASTIAIATSRSENSVPSIELLHPAKTALLVTSPGLVSNRSPFQRPRRFLQVHTFYSHYLQQLYAKVPGLAEAEFQQQIGALERDGFSAVHLFPEPDAAIGLRSATDRCKLPAGPVAVVAREQLHTREDRRLDDGDCTAAD